MTTAITAAYHDVGIELVTGQKWKFVHHRKATRLVAPAIAVSHAAWNYDLRGNFQFSISQLRYSSVVLMGVFLTFKYTSLYAHRRQKSFSYATTPDSVERVSQRQTGSMVLAVMFSPPMSAELFSKMVLPLIWTSDPEAYTAPAS